jgi:hypothetical protein
VPLCGAAADSPPLAAAPPPPKPRNHNSKGHSPLKIDDPVESKKGDAFRHSVRGWFAERIKNKQTSIFANN